MRFLTTALLLALLISCGNPGIKEPPSEEEEWPGTVRLLPENPRYLEYRNEPVILITSAEHYGALLNLDFDYRTYLETLAREGFNYTRIFTGTYIEPVENIFRIEKNTLAPLKGRFIAPWTEEDGKYDLTRFNEEYFLRLGDFMEEAERQGIVVEVTLFTSIYAENAWVLSPFHPENNVNQLEEIPFTDVNTLQNGGLKEYQEVFIRKMVKELNRYDHIFYEVQNEPWSDNGRMTSSVNQEDDSVFVRSWQRRVEVADQDAMEWQAWVVSVIRGEEKELPKKHLIAQNISNFVYEIKEVPEGVSLLNFHYALPEAVILNRKLQAAIGLDETGFMPHNDTLFINQAWRFMLTGGALYNNLDYSFTAGNEEGDWSIPDHNPGWGGPDFRKKLNVLAETIRQVPFHEMEFSDAVLSCGDQPVVQYGIQEPGRSYLVFVEGSSGMDLVPRVTPGRYSVTWINVHTGEKSSETMRLNREKTIRCPFQTPQAAVMINKTK